MRVGVLSLCRDRLAYTKHCFQTLRDNAGTAFDWFVLDQGSTDGTVDWLLEQDDLNVVALDENIGICRGINLVLDTVCDPADFDVIVRFDNDCEVLTPGALREVCTAALEHSVIVAPRVHGLQNPPATVRTTPIGEWLLDETHILGGIFMAIPTLVFEHGFRFDERMPLWTGDEAVVAWWRQRNGRAGYLHGFEVNHYLTTEGQKRDIPRYFVRRDAECEATYA